MRGSAELKGKRTKIFECCLALGALLITPFVHASSANETPDSLSSQPNNSEWTLTTGGPSLKIGLSYGFGPAH